MKFQDVAKVLLVIALCAGFPIQSSSNRPPRSGDTCVVKLVGVQFNCPAGWKIVEEIESGTTIGNFDRPDKTGNLTIPVGRASLTVHPMPKIYRNFKEWVYAATKIAPEAVQKNETLANKRVGPLNVICFTSPDSQQGLIYASYFFEINGTPVNMELTYQRTSPNASDYRLIPARIIESLEPDHR
jgi:hypothetical protein